MFLSRFLVQVHRTVRVKKLVASLLLSRSSDSRPSGVPDQFSSARELQLHRNNRNSDASTKTTTQMGTLISYSSTFVTSHRSYLWRDICDFDVSSSKIISRLERSVFEELSSHRSMSVPECSSFPSVHPASCTNLTRTSKYAVTLLPNTMTCTVVFDGVIYSVNNLPTSATRNRTRSMRSYSSPKDLHHFFRTSRASVGRNGGYLRQRKERFLLRSSTCFFLEATKSCSGGNRSVRFLLGSEEFEAILDGSSWFESVWVGLNRFESVRDGEDRDGESSYSFWSSNFRRKRNEEGYSYSVDCNGRDVTRSRPFDTLTSKILHVLVVSFSTKRDQRGKSS